MLEYVYLPSGLSTEGIFYPTASDYSRQCECVFARTIRANCSRELFARIIRVSVKRPLYLTVIIITVMILLQSGPVNRDRHPIY